jgi:hypothetical protein
VLPFPSLFDRPTEWPPGPSTSPPRPVANEEQLLSVLTTAEQKTPNALLRKLIAGL